MIGRRPSPTGRRHILPSRGRGTATARRGSRSVGSGRSRRGRFVIIESQGAKQVLGRRRLPLLECRHAVGCRANVLQTGAGRDGGVQKWIPRYRSRRGVVKGRGRTRGREGAIAKWVVGGQVEGQPRRSLICLFWLGGRHRDERREMRLGCTVGWALMGL